MQLKNRFKTVARRRKARKTVQNVHELGIYARSEDYVLIEIIYNKNNRIERERQGFKLVFEKRSGKIYAVHFTLDDRELYRTKLNDSTDLIQSSALHFKTTVRLFQNTVKKLVFRGSLFRNTLSNYDFGIANLRNLEVLEICDGFDFQQFAPLIRHPLKELQYLGHTDSLIVTDCQQIYEIRHRFGVPNITFNNEQFCKLSASHIQISIGELTEDDVSNFITSWQNGRIRENFQYCYWDLEGSYFDVSKLCLLLCIEDFLTGEDEVDIVQSTESGKIARLSFNDNGFDELGLAFYLKNDTRSRHQL